MDPELSSTPIARKTIVTHAHSDHTAAISGGAKTYLTEITLDLYNAAHQRNAKNFDFIQFHEPFEIGSFEVEFIKAGHLLGAAQIVVRQGKHNFLYTGDFCPENLLTVKGADIPSDIDLTVMDSTYGKPSIMFDDRSDTRQRLFVWAITQLNKNNIPILNVGHLGGAQELVRLFNTLANNLPILVHPKIESVNEIYQKHGIELNFISLFSDKAKSYLKDQCIILVPRSFKNIKSIINIDPSLKNKYVRAIVTGQSAKFGFKAFEFASPLSTHAHFNELLETTKKLNPSRVLTHFGFAKDLALHLTEKLNLPSKPLEDCDIMDLNKIQSESIPSRRARKIGYLPLDEIF